MKALFGIVLASALTLPIGQACRFPVPLFPFAML
jgi:hypothetical protein